MRVSDVLAPTSGQKTPDLRGVHAVKSRATTSVVGWLVRVRAPSPAPTSSQPAGSAASAPRCPHRSNACGANPAEASSYREPLEDAALYRKGVRRAIRKAEADEETGHEDAGGSRDCAPQPSSFSGRRNAGDEGSDGDAKEDGQGADVMQMASSCECRASGLAGDCVRDPNARPEQPGTGALGQPGSSARDCASVSQLIACGSEQQAGDDEVESLWGAAGWHGQTAYSITPPVITWSMTSEGREAGNEQNRRHRPTEEAPVE
jgi:hypothetical protein